MYCLVNQRLKHLPAMQKTWFDPWVRKIPWTRKWQPTPVCLPGESHGQRSLEGYSPWGCKESTRLNNFTFIYTFIALGKSLYYCFIVLGKSFIHLLQQFFFFNVTVIILELSMNLARIFYRKNKIRLP